MVTSGNVLDKAIRRLTANDPSLTELELSLRELRTEDVVRRVEALKTNSTLVSLRLDENSFRDEGAALLAEALKINTTLIKLFFSVDGVTAEGAGRQSRMAGRCIEDQFQSHPSRPHVQQCFCRRSRTVG